jgi:phenylacetate-CoA ligase
MQGAFVPSSTIRSTGMENWFPFLPWAYIDAPSWARAEDVARPLMQIWRTASAEADAMLVSQAPAQTWQAHRDMRLRALLHDIAPRSTFYRSRLNFANPSQSPLEQLQRIEPVRKRELMRHFDEWVTDPAVSMAALREFLAGSHAPGEVFADRYVVWESSGTSGEPGLFVQDAQAMAVADALTAVRGPMSHNAWTIAAPGSRTALVAAIHGHFAAVAAFERARRLNPWFGAASRTFSFLQPLQTLVAQLNDYQPTVLAAYPSMAWVLAQQQNNGALRIAPRMVCTGGETLTPALRHTLATTWNADVVDSYGASECFNIAQQCRSGHLHLNADWVVLEAVDSQGHPVPHGEMGENCWLTHLANQVQPIIRYELGDRIRFVPEPCACGNALPVIEVQGRSADVLTLKDAQGQPVHLAPLALTTVLEEHAGVFDFCLRRTGAHALRLDLYHEAPSAHDTLAAQALHDYLRQQGLARTRIELHHHRGGGARGRAGKQHRVVATSTP